jgi:light-harvesting complex II chlorophyll a/b binding protein 1
LCGLIEMAAATMTLSSRALTGKPVTRSRDMFGEGHVTMRKTGAKPKVAASNSPRYGPGHVLYLSLLSGEPPAT